LTSAKTTTKLKPIAEETQINTKVKAAKEAETTPQIKSEKPENLLKKTILITNDDVRLWTTALVDAVKDLGKVVVIAPDKAQSGMGHAITIGYPLRMVRVNYFGDNRSILLQRNACRLCKACSG